MKKILFILLVHSSLLGLAQNEMPKLVTGEPEGLIILNSREFNGSALWGYINGGADLYLEYGFNNLRVESIKLEGLEFTVNIYQMKDAAAAFGIFSVSRFNCTGKISGLNISCLSPYQLQFVKSQYYISIINETGDSKARETDLKLARILSAKIKGKDFEVPEIFTKKEFEGSFEQAKFMKGKLGLENGYPGWSEFFNMLGEVQVYMVVLKENESRINIAEIVLEDKKSGEQLYKNLGLDFNNPIKGIESYSGDGRKCLLPVSENSFVFFESREAPEQISPYLQLFK